MIHGNVGKKDFDQFDSYNERDGSPYGSDVVVHAITPDGTGYIVSLMEVDKGGRRYPQTWKAATNISSERSRSYA